MPGVNHLCVVGGGLVGLATALRISQAGLAREITVLEKESGVGRHQSGRNSGVLHCGLYYRPGSLKAKLAVEGISSMTAFCQEHGVPHEICGKIVVATNAREIAGLRQLLERGTANGLVGLRWLSPPEIKEIEPFAGGVAGLHVPQEGIVDYRQVTQAMADEIQARGHTIRTCCELTGLRHTEAELVLETTTGSHNTDFLINCAGLQCDRVFKLTGRRPSCRIVPFRGEYFTLTTHGSRLVRNLIYPVPDPAMPFLGVHFTRMIGGRIEAGPNAVLAFKREGYRKWDFSLRDMADTFTWPGFYRFISRYPAATAKEFFNSTSRTVFISNLRRLVPELQSSDVQFEGGAGVRAQAIERDGSLVMDFRFERGPRQLHVLNAPSPGATASLAIGKHIASEVLREVA